MRGVPLVTKQFTKMFFCLQRILVYPTLALLVAATQTSGQCVPFRDSFYSEPDGPMNIMPEVGVPWEVQGPNSNIFIKNGELSGGEPSDNNVFYISPSSPLRSLTKLSASFVFVPDTHPIQSGDGTILLGSAKMNQFVWGAAFNAVHLVLARHYANLTIWNLTTGQRPEIGRAHV